MDRYRLQDLSFGLIFNSVYVNGETMIDENMQLPSKVFITGANGFIGRALARRYRELGAIVTGVDFIADTENGVISADLTQPVQWSNTLAGVDAVVHCAALVSNTASMTQAWAVNVKATADLLAACTQAQVEHFVQLSSVAAFGFDFDTICREEDPLCTNGNSYVDTKIACEHIVLAAHASGSINCTILRPTDVYGPRSKPWVMLPIEMMRARTFLLPAHGLGVFSPVYIDDLVDGVLHATAIREARGQIFNIGGGEQVSCEQFFSYHAAMIGLGRPRSIGSAPALLLARAVGGIGRLLGSDTELGKGTVAMLSRKSGYCIEKAGRILGYQPQVELVEGMRRTEDWARETGLI